MRIAITGPTGNVGRRLVGHLVSTDHDLVLFARDPDEVPAEVRDRVDVVQGDLQNAADVRRLLDGADALFYLPPPNFALETDNREWLQDLGRTAADAVRGAGVERVVMVSSYGAQADGFGAISGSGDIERMLDEAAPNVVHLRAGSLMENFMSALGPIAEDGVLYHAAPPDLPVPMVATRDVADAAARWLADDAWTGHQTVGVHGPEDLTHVEAARQIGEGLGREVRYVQVPINGFLGTLAEHGAGGGFVASYRQILETWDRGETHQVVPRTPATTTPTTLRQFAEESMAPALRDRAVEAGSR